MRFHCNTTPEETIAYLRDQAIAAKQPPAVIDAIDELGALLDLPADLEKEQQEASALQNAVDDLREELEQAANALREATEALETVRAELSDDTDSFSSQELKEWKRQVEYATKALERHKA